LLVPSSLTMTYFSLLDIESTRFLKYILLSFIFWTQRMIISFWQLELGPDGAEIHTSLLSSMAAILTSFLWYLVEVLIIRGMAKLNWLNAIMCGLL
jgi:hypothetical protein